MNDNTIKMGVISPKEKTMKHNCDAADILHNYKHYKKSLTNYKVSYTLCNERLNSEPGDERIA